MVVWYSVPRPRTKPAMKRPAVRLSIIANSSAMVSGSLMIGSARPSTQIFAVLVRRASAPASTLGAGIMP